MIKSFASAILAAVALSVDVGQVKKNDLDLAEVIGGHTCASSSTRNKAAVADFFSLKKATTKYTDADFTADASSIYWADMGESTSYLSQTATTWKRASELGGYSLFGNGISYDDARQGTLGDCWFVSSMAAIAEKPKRLQKIFLNTEAALNSNGVYAVNIHMMGVPHTIVVDDYLPTSDGKTLKYTQPGKDKSLWAAILEKAYAKAAGNYWHMEGGMMYRGVRAIVGGAYEAHKHSASTADALWKELVAHDGKDDIIQAGTSANGAYHSLSTQGLVAGHAYTVLGTKKLSNGTRLVKMRNPWGKETYKGEWSDNSAKWTAALKKEVNLVQDTNDGVFYIAVENFQKSFSTTHVSYDPADQFSNYFLRLNDDGTGKQASGCAWANAKCNSHLFTITSSVAQNLWVQVQTWDDNILPAKCKATTTGHIVKASFDTMYYQITQSSWEFKKYAIKANESITIQTDMLWSDPNRAKDFSVVAHGDKAKVSITHKGGLTSQHLPVAKNADGTAYVPPANPAIAKVPASTTTTTTAKKSTTTYKIWDGKTDFNTWLNTNYPSWWTKSKAWWAGFNKANNMTVTIH